MNGRSPGLGAMAAALDDWISLVMVVGLAGILTAAMVLQYGFGEVPCPLCLLERVAMFGICFGPLRRFRQGGGARNIGLGLVSALVLLVVSARQVLLDICPLPGRTYVGSAVLGLHMPVWSVIVAIAVLAGCAAQLALFGEARPDDRMPPRPVTRIAGYAGLYVTALCAINLVSALLQCGFGECHTTGYSLL